MKYDKNVVAVCKNGTYVGFRQDGVIKFLGIPFARVKRWQRGLPLTTTSEDVFEAFSYGKSPFQDPASSVVQDFSEDCLNLNLYASDILVPKKAVMVWVTGGAEIVACNAGLKNFDGTQTLYDPSTFVRENPDIIVLSVNYRVGFWGTADLSVLDGFRDEYRHSCNLARLDLLTALKWVRENIPGFGGDPGNVTLFGQSAGSNNITSLMFMEEAIPYFKNAICQSSFAMDISLTNPEDGKKVSRMFFERLGVHTVQEALAASNEEIYRVQMELNRLAGATHLPGVESKFLSTAQDNVSIKQDYWKFLMSGAMKGKTLVFGTNSGEYDLQFAPFAQKVDLEGAKKMLLSHCASRISPEEGSHPEYLEQYLAHYSSERDELTALMDMKTDLYVRTAAVSFAKSLCGITDTYMYFLDEHKGAGYMDRCHHGREIEALFDNPGVLPEELKRVIRDVWASVARTGDPNCGSLAVKWEKFGPDHETLRLSRNPKMVKGVHMDDIALLIPSFREYQAFPEFAALWK